MKLNGFSLRDRLRKVSRQTICERLHNIAMKVATIFNSNRSSHRHSLPESCGQKYQKYLRIHISVLNNLQICETFISELFPEIYLDIFSRNAVVFKYSPIKGLSVIKLLTRTSLKGPVNQVFSGVAGRAFLKPLRVHKTPHCSGYTQQVIRKMYILIR
jgi:hypothetical protein